MQNRNSYNVLRLATYLVDGITLLIGATKWVCEYRIVNRSDWQPLIILNKHKSIMSDNFEEVFVSILFDEGVRSSQNLKEYLQILSDIKAIKGVKHVHLTLKPDIADTTAFADWKRSEIDTKLEEIRKIPGIRNVEGKVLVAA